MNSPRSPEEIQLICGRNGFPPLVKVEGHLQSADLSATICTSSGLTALTFDGKLISNSEESEKNCCVHY